MVLAASSGCRLLVTLCCDEYIEAYSRDKRSASEPQVKCSFYEMSRSIEYCFLSSQLIVEGG